MKNILEEIVLLIQFMTRIPIGLKVDYSEEKLGRGIKYFPLVGLIIGLILFVFTNIFLFYKLNNFMIAIFIILLEIKIVGLIHLDGLSDSFDALFSYRDKERMLEIMKDSRVGANGVIVLILYFLCKFIFLSELLKSGDLRLIILYPVISRLSTSFNAAFGEYARDKGMSTGIIGMNKKKDGIFSVVLTLFITLLIYNIKYLGNFTYNGIISIIFGLIFIIYFRSVVYKKIDGITGDTMGASLELVSLVVLMLGAILK